MASYSASHSASVPWNPHAAAKRLICWQPTTPPSTHRGDDKRSKIDRTSTERHIDLRRESPRASAPAAPSSHVQLPPGLLLPPLSVEALPNALRQANGWAAALLERGLAPGEPRTGGTRPRGTRSHAACAGTSSAPKSRASRTTSSKSAASTSASFKHSRNSLCKRPLPASAPRRLACSTAARKRLDGLIAAPTTVARSASPPCTPRVADRSASAVAQRTSASRDRLLDSDSFRRAAPKAAVASASCARRTSIVWRRASASCSPRGCINSGRLLT
mmetsp:Transcript_10773/g.30680  ORF Transcript_10773/g.30680 Transcript_10773/m.30680 type:complete len:275 (+) Transcript_10773:656-1480(+)